MNTVMKNEEKKEYYVPEMTVLEFVQEENLLCGSPNDPCSEESFGFDMCGGSNGKDCD